MDDERNTITSPEDDPDVVLVHISDLHFSGFLQNVHGEGELSAIAKTQDFIVLMDMESHILPILQDHKQRLGFIVSGDLTTAAEPPAFETVTNYLFGQYRISEDMSVGLKLFDEFKLQGRVVVVPGNHDSWPKVGRLTRWRRYADRRHLFPKYFEQTGRMGIRPTVINRHSILFVTLDSNQADEGAFSRFRNTIGKGRVGREQIGRIEGEYAALASNSGQKVPDGFQLKSALRVAVLHHHPLLPSNVSIDIEQKLLRLEDTEEVINLFKSLGVNLVLCGHQHFPFEIVSDQPNDFWISCAGSATQRNNAKNSFRAYYFKMINGRWATTVVEYVRSNEGKRFAKFAPRRVVSLLF